MYRGEEKLAYYQDNGATSGCLQDAEREYLVAQGAAEASTQDMWYEALTVSGYTGSLSDMLTEFWENNSLDWA